mgnify:CR=1 FL=1
MITLGAFKFVGLGHGQGRSCVGLLENLGEIEIGWLGDWGVWFFLFVILSIGYLDKEYLAINN